MLSPACVLTTRSVVVELGRDAATNPVSNRLGIPMLQLTVTRPVNVRISWLLWVTLFVAATTSTLAGHRRDVSYHYRAASQRWLHREPLYDETGGGFLYFPQSAILYVPFAILPNNLSEILWRSLILSVFAVGVFRLARLAGRGSGIEFFPLTTMFCLPLAFSSERNGQATLIMAGLMMLATVDLVDKKWWRAAAYLSLGLAIKPLCLVLVLLAAVLYPATMWRLAICICVWAAMPFLAAEPSYVIHQYFDCANMLQIAADRGRDPNWSQLFGMLQVFGINVSSSWQTILRAVAAAGTLALAWYAQRRWPRSWAGAYCYALAICYLMLFNPRTENNSYAALAPVIGILCSNDVLVQRRYWMSALYIVISLGILGTYYAGILFTGPELTMWLAPLMATLFSVTAVVKLFYWPEPYTVRHL
jgi:alpha-1,2-mannosyltransferase